MSGSNPQIATRSRFEPAPAGNLALDWAGRAASVSREQSYRPEIDGLRAIAVVMVVLYHAKFKIAGQDLFSGGFIGVDIFLVISGYLIGMILLREIREQRFALVKFYERRARRILPALYVVLLATIPAAWLLVLPQSFKEYAWGLESAVASVSNFFFWHEVSYDASSNLTNPLIHTWSLGVEEQFYLLFPGLLLFLNRYLQRWMTQALAGMTLLSLVAAEAMTAYAPDASFFLLPARIWELGIGALLAMRELREGGRPASRTIPLLGLAAIFASLPFMELEHHHPGLMTLVPVIGTAAVIHYGGRADPASRWLSSRPMVAIGLISYSFYLWHQPVLAFGRLAVGDEPTAPMKLGWILMAMMLAVATFALVERPIRDRRKVPAVSVWMIAAGGAVLLLVSGASLIRSNGAPGRFPAPLDAIVKAEHMGEADVRQPGKNCLNYVPEQGPCRFGTPGASGYDLLVIGDSHARLLSGAMIENGALKEKFDASPLISGVTLLTRGGCPFLLGLSRVDGRKPQCPDSYNVTRMRYALAQGHAIAIVMMRLPILIEHSRFDNGSGGVEPGSSVHLSLAAGPYDQSADYRTIGKSLATTVDSLLDGGLKVVLVYPIPEIGWQVPQKLFRLATTEEPGTWLSPTQASVSYNQFKARSRRTYALLDALGERPDLLRVYPERVFCRADRCLSHEGATIFYRDNNHLSQTGADLLAAEILAAMEQRWGRGLSAR